MTTAIPSEFAGFLRETGMRAFDQLAVRAKDLDPPLRNFLRNWSRLSENDKVVLLDELIDTVRTPAKPEPKRAVKRYDPDEVAATLPKKPRAKRKTTSKKK